MFVIEKTSFNSFKITGDGSGTDIVIKTEQLLPDTYTYSTIQPTVTSSTGGSAVYASPNYTLGNGLGTSYVYTFTFSTDAVYKMTCSSHTTVHLFISQDSLAASLKSYMDTIICCNTEQQCRCNEDCKDYYDYNVLSTLAQTMLGLNLDVNFNYGTISSGILFTGYEYQCTVADSGSAHWQDDTTDLLLKPDNTLLGDTDTIVVGDVYTCFQTGTPDAYDSGKFTALTDKLITILDYIADSLDRVEDYENLTCDNSNDSCSC